MCWRRLRYFFRVVLTRNACRSSGQPDNTAQSIWIEEIGMRSSTSLTAVAAVLFSTATAQAAPLDLGTFGGMNSLPIAINNAGDVTGSAALTGDGSEHAFLYSGGVMTDLGTFGGTFSYPIAINEAGDVIGRADLAGDGSYHGFLYSGGVLTDLGTLGGSHSFPTAINNSGTIVGTASTAGGQTHAFIYAGGVMTDLAVLGSPNSYPAAINNAGDVVGYADTAGGETHAFLYTGGVVTDLGTFGGTLSYATAINDAGDVMGRASLPGDSSFHAFLYSGGVMTDIGTLGGASSDPSAINDAGDIVGQSVTATGETHPFLYSGGVMTDLGTFGGTTGFAMDINDAGDVMGYAFLAGDSSYHAFLYSDGVMTDLGTLGGSNSIPLAMNAAGEVVGRADTASGESHAFLYSGGVMTDLGTLGGSNSYARAINDAGQVVGEASIAGDAGEHAFLDPCPGDLLNVCIADADGDGIPDVDDNCPDEANPDQRNSDCSGTGAGCNDGGDLCDPCPAKANNNCDLEQTAATVIGSAGGTLITQNGAIEITIPAGALDNDTSVSVTENVTEWKLGPNAFPVYKIFLAPEGLVFNIPVSVIFRWPDDPGDGDSKVDLGTCGDGITACSNDLGCVNQAAPTPCSRGGNLRESQLRLKRNSCTFSDTVCTDPAHVPGGSCETTTATGAGSPCVSSGDLKARCCDTIANEWEFETIEFSDYLLGPLEADLVPGKGSPKTDCIAEIAVNNPSNSPALDKKGAVNFKQLCTDGDPTCDVDGTADGVCTLQMGLCFNVDDPRLEKGGVVQCAPSNVRTVELKKPRPDSSRPHEATSAVNLRGALTALEVSTVSGKHDALVTYSPAITNPGECSELVQVLIPLKAPGRKGKSSFKIRTTTGIPMGETKGVRDSDKLKVTCLPSPEPES